MLTESEAKQRWCPFVRVADCGSNNSVASNRSCAKEVNYNCIASECMAWEWHDSVIGNRSLHEDTPPKSGKITFEAGEVKFVKPLKDRRGDCGLKRK